MLPSAVHLKAADAPGESSFPGTAFSSWLESKRLENCVRIASIASARPGVERSRLVAVVDDEPVVAVTLAEILQRNGLDAVWFTEPVNALAFIEANRIDLLLSDVTMPVLDGICLAERTRRVQPDSAVILFSAVSEETSTLERVRSLNLPLHFEAKPLRVDRLLASVRALLAGDAGAVV